MAEPELDDFFWSDTEMRQEERDLLFRSESDFENASALCLSGGGIRAATFSLGVMQGLARKGELEGFNYLSTVSGGGYAGCWLSRWRAGSGEEFDWHDLHSTAQERDADTNTVTHPVAGLRGFSNYMSPRWGLSLDSLIVATIFVRNLIFNLLVWLPLILAMASLPRALVAFVDPGWRLDGKSHPIIEWPDRPGWLFAGYDLSVIWLAVSIGAIWLVLSFLFVLLPFWLREGQREMVSRLLASIAGCGLLLFLFLTVFVLLPHWLSAYYPEFKDYLRAAAYPQSPAAATKAADGSDIARMLLILLDQGKQQQAIGAGIGGTLVAALVAIFAFWSQHGPEVRRQSIGLANRLGSRLFNVLAGFALLVILVSAAFAVDYLARFFPDLSTFFGAGPRMAGTLLFGQMSAVFMLVAIIASFFVGANRFSLHGLYGNRLKRAYLGVTRKDRKPKRWTDLDPADDIEMEKLRESQIGLPKASGPTLFHVVNMTQNLSGSKRRAWQERKAASFTATALRAGSAVSGYAAIEDYGKALSLGRAMTISGAAASPNMGYYGATFVTAIMTLLNVRLGWWLPGPRHVAKQAKRRREAADDTLGEGESAPTGTSIIERLRMVRARLWPNEPPLQLWYLVKEVFSLVNEKTNWQHLSDGGHFDNLGLYEMVRRRCRKIVVVDAGCDGEFEYSDLQNAIRKVRADFGIRIDLPPTLPGQPGPGEKQRVVVGKIWYSDAGPGPQDGLIYVLKPILTGNEPPSLTQYARSSRHGGETFPHHTTLDQFFTETQFESYRMLGEISSEDVAKAIAATGKSPSNLFPSRDSYEVTVPVVEAAYPLRDPTTKLERNPPPEDIAKGAVAIEAEPPPARTSGFSGIMKAIESMSALKIAASTVAAATVVGASVEVGEKLAHKVSHEVGWRDTEIELIGPRKPLTIAEPGWEVPVQGIDQVIAELSEMKGHLNTIAENVGGGGGGVSVKELQDTIVKLETSLQGAADRFDEVNPGKFAVDARLSPENVAALNRSLQVISNRLEAGVNYNERMAGELARIEARLRAVPID